MIRPIYVELQNFCSFGNKKTKIDFPGPGQKMLIMGDIGSGKSSIINALLYSIATKRIDSSTLVNTINKKNMLVTAAWHIDTMDKPLVIRRGMKPPKFEIEGVDRSLQAETKRHLSEKIHITDPQVLLNLCALSISKSLPFFELKKQDRLNFLRNFVDASRLDELTEMSKEIHLSANKEVIKNTSTLDVLREQLSEVETKLQSIPEEVDIETLSDEELNELESLITTTEEKEQKLQEALRDHTVSDTRQALDEKLVEVTNDFNQTTQILRKIEGEKLNLKRSITEAKADMEKISDDAAECAEYFLDLIKGYEKRLHEVEADKEQIDLLLVDIKKEKEEINDAITEEINRAAEEKEKIRQELDEVQRNKMVLLQTREEDRQARSAKAEAQARIDAHKDLENLRSDLKDKIDEAKLELAKSTRVALVSKEYRKILDNTWGYMANQMVPFLNSRLPHYMQELDLDFYMQFDPHDISKPHFHGRAGVGDLKLSDLSTGQKGMTSIALAHSLRDLEAAAQGKEVSFLILDEISANISHDRVNHLMDFENRYAKKHGIALIVITHDVALQGRPDWDMVYKVTRDTFSRVKRLK